ncbi:AraC family transcriptional regulator [Ruminococcus sp. CLA-AA-H200]|uniref:AraC family transcriptional regulator n=1 Tax=Ruminococcus turbiniformis TaxID=2881258 RepID=A0ABS8G018_9FIRM|nr:AraC family transcriptional regulator [Ruminococcus turbiniformis]MCC2255229.1 AraC family transcriptional regulator [Ruminococcus turbiniformis]
MPQFSELLPSQKEQATHGEPLFPLKRYVTMLSQVYPSVAPHWHDEAELTMITEGQCTYHIHLDSYKAAKGDILFIPPAELHSISTEPDENMKSDTFVFHMDFLGANAADICSVRYLAPIARHTLLLPYIIRKDHPAYGKISRIFRDMNRLYESGTAAGCTQSDSSAEQSLPDIAPLPPDAPLPGYELFLKSLLLSAVASLIPYQEAAHPRTRLEDEHTAKLKMVLDYIDGHYAEELSVRDLAKLCYFSEYHFMRFFKKYTGTSCLEYIKNLRLEKAASRLAQGSQSVLDISMSCGFLNLSYFYREFKKKYKMTPKQFIRSAPAYPFAAD